MNEELIIEVWETFRDYIPEKTRQTAASQFVEFLQGHDVDDSVLEGLKGYDPHLDEAIDLVLDSDDESEEDDENYEDWHEGDDEDY